MQLRFIKYAIPAAFLLSWFAYHSAERAAPYMVIKPRKHSTGPTPQSLNLPAEHFKLRVADSLYLDAYYIPAATSTPKAILIGLHGIGNNKEAWLHSAQMFHNSGYATLLYDARAHGASDGTYCTLGFFEKYDVSKAADWLAERHPDIPIGVIGNSMGGAVALQALAIEPRLRFGIVQCSFTDLRSVVHAYQKRYAKGLSFEEFTDESLVEAGKIAHFDPAQVCPVCVAPNIKQPVLLIHGSRDINIAPRAMDSIYAALGSSYKEKLLVDGADHYNLAQVGGEGLNNRMLTFLDSVCQTRQPKL